MCDLKQSRACFIFFHKPMNETLFHPLETDIKPPTLFTYPFNYTPHPLCLMAAAEVQSYIAQHDSLRREADEGKMFGVLVAKDSSGQLGFLAAFSGMACGKSRLPWFVPPITEAHTDEHGVFRQNEHRVKELGAAIAALENSPQTATAKQRLADAEADAAAQIAAYKQLMQHSKQRREALRAAVRQPSPEQQEAMTKESQFQKAELKRLRRRLDEQLSQPREAWNRIAQQAEAMKQQRRTLAEAAQRWLFGKYLMLNGRGETCSLTAIFAHTPQGVPPSGAGECCAPKLLQHAYANALKPLCMAEFWWGKSPKTEIRHHLHYYPSCRSKCKPILGFMLQGLDVEPNPHDTAHSGTHIRILHKDESIIVVCKPSGMLSMPGRVGRTSVVEALRSEGETEGFLMPAHRLDMDTSGLLVVARTEAALRNLHAQFAAGTVRKRYTAVLDGTVAPGTAHHGVIRLPLAADENDRPRQIVDPIHGKPAITEYNIERTDGNKTRVSLFPHTGRTHQLRVHCAHADGLAVPIAGDTLYGHPSGIRLMLHAEYISFCHPLTGKRVQFSDKRE